MERRIGKGGAMVLGLVIILAAVHACSQSLPASAQSRARSFVDAAASSRDLSRPAGKEWPVFGGDEYNTRYSTLHRINVHNISSLGAVWVSERFEEDGQSRVTPIIHDGVMFVTAGRQVYALNAKTGVKLWSYKTSGGGFGPDAVPNDRGVGLGAGMVFVGLKDGHVIALDEKTGVFKWARQTGAAQLKKGQTAAVPPLYIDGYLLTGLSNADVYVRGKVAGLNAQTGEELWSFYSVPSPGEPGSETWPSDNDVWQFGGGGVWSALAVDQELGLVYATTGNAVPVFGGDWRPGNNLYTCSVVAIDLHTGQLRWYYQLVHHDVFDGDVGTPVVLFDLPLAGARRKALAALRSDGYLYVLDRETGMPLLPVEERPVPQLASQKTAPTQPFPVGGESVLMSCDDWKKKEIPAGFALGCMWTAPASITDPQNVLAPFPSVRAVPMAYSPLTGYLYAQGTSMLGWPRRSTDPFFVDFGRAVPGLKPRRDLVAIDPRTEKIVWRTPLPATVAHGLPDHSSGGPIVTAGGLLFQSLGDGNIAGFDATNGAALWRFQAGTPGASGTPVSYEIDGEQYLAVPIGAAIWAFKLGGKIPAPPDPGNAPAEIFAGPVIDTTQIETASLVTAASGSGTRYFIDEYAFHPYRSRVKAGTAVLFVNNGDLYHQIAALDGSWNTASLGPTQEAFIRFDKPGRYTFICKDHPWTYGEIIVVPAD